MEQCVLLVKTLLVPSFEVEIEVVKDQPPDERGIVKRVPGSFLGVDRELLAELVYCPSRDTESCMIETLNGTRACPFKLKK